MISKSHKFIFIHIPKTAGNSISLSIIDLSEDKIVFNEHQEKYNQIQGKIHRFQIESLNLELKNKVKHSNPA